MTTGARGLMAAADKIEARIVEAEKLRTALEEIQRLHQPMMFPVGAKLEHWVKLCSVCCFEESSNRQTEDCELCHEHTAEGPACSTAEIIARAGL